MSLEIIDLLKEGLNITIFGDPRIAYILVIIFVFMLLVIRDIPKAFIFMLILPFAYILRNQIYWLFLILLIIIGFIFGDALVKLFRQEY